MSGKAQSFLFFAIPRSAACNCRVDPVMAADVLPRNLRCVPLKRCPSVEHPGDGVLLLNTKIPGGHQTFTGNTMGNSKGNRPRDDMCQECSVRLPPPSTQLPPSALLPPYRSAASVACRISHLKTNYRTCPWRQSRSVKPNRTLRDNIPNINQMQLPALVAMGRIECDLRTASADTWVCVAPPFTRVWSGGQKLAK